MLWKLQLEGHQVATCTLEPPTRCRSMFSHYTSLRMALESEQPDMVILGDNSMQGEAMVLAEELPIFGHSLGHMLSQDYTLAMRVMRDSGMWTCPVSYYSNPVSAASQYAFPEDCCMEVRINVTPTRTWARRALSRDQAVRIFESTDYNFGNVPVTVTEIPVGKPCTLWGVFGPNGFRRVVEVETLPGGDSCTSIPVDRSDRLYRVLLKKLIPTLQAGKFRGLVGVDYVATQDRQYHATNIRSGVVEGETEAVVGSYGSAESMLSEVVPGSPEEYAGARTRCVAVRVGAYESFPYMDEEAARNIQRLLRQRRYGDRIQEPDEVFWPARVVKGFGDVYRTCGPRFGTLVGPEKDYPALRERAKEIESGELHVVRAVREVHPLVLAASEDPH